MTAVSLSVSRGWGYAGEKISDVTVGTSAPTATFDIEVRYNLLDTNSVGLTRMDIYHSLKALARFLQQGGSNVATLRMRRRYDRTGFPTLRAQRTSQGRFFRIRAGLGSHSAVGGDR